MKKTDAIKALIEIKAIAYNNEHNANKRLDDIIKILKRLPSELTRPPMRVCVNGVTYASVEDAAKKLKLYPITVRNRIVSQNEKFKGWTVVYTP